MRLSLMALESEARGGFIHSLMLLSAQAREQTSQRMIISAYQPIFEP